MTNVYAWPPVGLTAWENTLVQPVSRSVGLIDGRPRTSSAQRARRYATAIVSGIGDDGMAAGRIEVVKELLDGGRHLVRIPAMSPVWHLRAIPYALQALPLQWSTGGVPLLFTAGGTSLLWGAGDFALTGAPTTLDGWPAATVSGLPPNDLVARPADRFEITDGTTTQVRSVLTAVRSNGSGVAVVPLGNGAITISGSVSLGATSSFVAEALSLPRAVQPASGDWTYSWDFRQVFSDEYADGWTDVAPPW